MAGSSLIALIDDIATILDDVSVMTKVAAKKTAGVLGDDLALNAQQVAGVKADRELPVVWAVAKGSAVNKLILVPVALFLNAFIRVLVTPLLMIGGAFLCYEGIEKIVHKLLHGKEEDQQHHKELVEAVANPAVDMVAFEKEKVKGAIRTDFILSAEIIVITLDSVKDASFWMQLGVLSLISVVMTIGVYGLVGGIVKLDDAGLHLSKSGNGAVRALGNGLLGFAPRLMKFLSVVGTAAMFLVGGGIVVHNVESLHHLVQHAAHAMDSIPGGVMLTETLLNLVVGVIIGGVVLLGVNAVKGIIGRVRGKPAQH